MHLAELKTKTPAELLNFAESLQIENVSSLRKQDIMFSILKSLAESDQIILGEGTLEILSDGFGYLRSPEANYLPGPDDIYVSPNLVRRYGCAPATPSKARSARRRMANVISRWRKSSRSISNHRTLCVIASISTT